MLLPFKLSSRGSRGEERFPLLPTIAQIARNRAFFQFRRGYAAYAMVFMRGYVILAYVGNRAATEFLRYVTLPLGRFSASSVCPRVAYIRSTLYGATTRAFNERVFDATSSPPASSYESSAEYERAIDDKPR